MQFPNIITALTLLLYTSSAVSTTTEDINIRSFTSRHCNTTTFTVDRNPQSELSHCQELINILRTLHFSAEYGVHSIARQNRPRISTCIFSARLTNHTDLTSFGMYNDLDVWELASEAVRLNANRPDGKVGASGTMSCRGIDRYEHREPWPVEVEWKFVGSA
ncbi:hypothetical protein QBC38DRAFT_455363 [Podospora fimiseda]|uniref:Ecp2 effector protein-like domain-containing protein n=1 Tax=Podospora fimiseda TaxID=252190 RepID=A0AAN7BPX1_9PEZI|nr:hypothetical protein QBC38DRAFT_455363 [Podospora fimiseda]